MEAIIVKKIWLTETAIWIQTEDGKVAHGNHSLHRTRISQSSCRIERSSSCC